MAKINYKEMVFRVMEGPFFSWLNNQIKIILAIVFSDIIW